MNAEGLIQFQTLRRTPSSDFLTVKSDEIKYDRSRAGESESSPNNPIESSGRSSVPEKHRLIKIPFFAIHILIALVSLVGVVLLILFYRDLSYTSFALGGANRCHVYLNDGRFTFCVGSTSRMSLVDAIFGRDYVLSDFESLSDRREYQIEFDRRLREFSEKQKADFNPRNITRASHVAEAEFEELRARKKLTDMMAPRASKFISYSIDNLAQQKGFLGIVVRSNFKARERFVLSLPSWFSFGVLSFAPILLFVKAFRRRGFDPLITCRKCRYNLTGLTGRICPECGTEMLEKQRQAIVRCAK